ncbi:MAG: hypothetical protein OEY07_19325 [Gammaproteobacteria bacterium]|nr:hypothetical protein [Gammaproteobacteria bacterium]
MYIFKIVLLVMFLLITGCENIPVNKTAGSEASYALLQKNVYAPLENCSARKTEAAEFAKVSGLVNTIFKLGLKEEMKPKVDQEKLKEQFIATLAEELAGFYDLQTWQKNNEFVAFWAKKNVELYPYDKANWTPPDLKKLGNGYEESMSVYTHYEAIYNDASVAFGAELFIQLLSAGIAEKKISAAESRKMRNNIDVVMAGLMGKSEKNNLSALSYMKGTLKRKPEAMFVLAALYHKGSGVLQNNVMAHALMGAAAELGYEEAIRKKNFVKDSLTPSQLNRAQAIKRYFLNMSDLYACKPATINFYLVLEMFSYGVSMQRNILQTGGLVKTGNAGNKGNSPRFVSYNGKNRIDYTLAIPLSKPFSAVVDDVKHNLNAKGKEYQLEEISHRVGLPAYRLQSTEEQRGKKAEIVYIFFLHKDVVHSVLISSYQAIPASVEKEVVNDLVFH